MNDTATTSSAAGIRWNLGELYAAPDDPRIAADREAALRQAEAFEKDYRGKVAGLEAAALHEAVARQEGIAAAIRRPLLFAQLRFAGDTGDASHGALLQAAREAYSEVSRRLLFFGLEWVAVKEQRAQALLADPALAGYRHYLAETRKQKPFLLSEPEEKILTAKAVTGPQAFQRLFEEVVGALRCRVAFAEETRELSLQEALALLYRPERELRAAAAQGVTAALQERQRVLTFIFNTLVAEHADDDRLRGRTHPMQARNLDNEIDQASVDALLDACDRHMPTVARYYALKRRLLGYDILHDYDRYAPVGGNLPPRRYGEAREIVLDAYRAFSPRMAEVAARFFAGDWIDAELRPGKTGGAFSAGGLPELHPYILLNYTDNLRDVMTMAHELGHGIHQYLARPRGLFQFQTPLTTAETASVFGEMLTFHRLMAAEDDPRVRLELLCGKLEDIFATVFRQAAMTRFEQALHAARRGGGELDGAAIGRLWMEANRAMFGDSVELGEDYAHWWGYISHFIHAPFYCYAYAFGELLVLALYRRYQEEGEAFAPKYEALLEAGGSAPPAELLARMGLDITAPDFWEQGLVLLDGMVGEAEQLAAALEEK